MGNCNAGQVAQDDMINVRQGLTGHRFVSLRARGRELSTPSPGPDQYVPVDDAAWEQDVRL